jgi:hypothetical protein
MRTMNRRGLRRELRAGIRVRRGNGALRTLALATVMAILSPLRSARADGDTAQSGEGTVVQVESDDLVVDLGSSRGVESGDVVEIWRPLRVRHPVTGRSLTDRFLIGKLRLTQVRSSMSLAVPDGALSREARAGDIVVPPHSAPFVLPGLAHKQAPPEPAAAPGGSGSFSPTQSPSPPPPTPTPEQIEDKELSTLFDSLHGASVVERIQAYERFAGSHPNGRRTTFLIEEARALRGLLTLSERQQAPEPQALPLTAESQPIRTVVAHEPVRIAVAIHRGAIPGAHPGALGVVLHVRQKGAETYESLPMAPSGPMGAAAEDTEYWAAIVPPELVEPPELRYFVEAVDEHGTAPVIASAGAPDAVEVQDVLPRTAKKYLGEAALSTDYASFNARATNDYIWQTEGYMGVRFGDVGIRALRTGFGVYRGEYGFNVPQVESVGLTYGYLETEFGLARSVSIGIRGTVGLDNSGVQGGAFGFLRIGSDLGTNLWFGAEGLGGIGVRGITQLEWNAWAKWPIVLRAEVTDEPAGGAVGARAVAQVGYRFARHLVVSLRGSYEGRTIQESGPGGGGAVAYAW